MKRALYLFFVLLMVSVPYAYGDEMKSVKLDNRENNKKNIPLSFCNIFIELLQEDENGQYGITIKMENISEDKILYLFDHSYNEKALKKTCGLVYDKLFPGAKGKRIAEACEHLSESCRLTPSSETKSIISLKTNESSVKFRLPIYIAREVEKDFLISKKSKVSLAQLEVIELDLNIEVKPDEDFVRLSAAADSLVDEIKSQTFCSNKNHRGSSLKTLHSIYNKSIDELKKQVTQIINLRKYMSSDKGYIKFDSIYKQLESVNLEQLTVTSCAKDKKIKSLVGHNCKFCSLSAENIYKRLESYYIDLHNGKKTKQQVMADVEALYNCAQKNNKRSTGSFMSRISMYYNKIKSK